MKKFFVMLFVALMAAGATAQVVTSRTYVKSKKATTWYARVGMSINNMAGGGEFSDLSDMAKEYGGELSLGSRIGATVDFGFQRPIGNFGLYWGMELGLGSRGFSFKELGNDEYDPYEAELNVSAWNVKYSPFTFGYKYSITDDLKLDAHIGAFLSYDFTGSTGGHVVDGADIESVPSWSEFKDNVDYTDFDAGMQIGIGAWWKKFNIDFTYQRGFVKAFTLLDSSETYSPTFKSSNFMIRVGYAF